MTDYTPRHPLLGIVNEVVIPPDLEGSRLDRALATLLPDRSRSFLVRVIENGHVHNGDKAITKPSYPVSTGESFRVEIPPAVESTVLPQAIPIPVLFEDRCIAVIDKPAGIVVHPAAGHSDGTLANALLFQLTDLSGVGGVIRPGIVHRLDKDTTGVMVIAKNDDVHRRLTSVWGSQRVQKEYIALVYGTPKERTGTIDLPLGRDPRDRKKMAVVEGGRKAITEYHVERTIGSVSLVRCRLRTGRTHQIRVHLKAIGHPIVGDPAYSGPQWKGIQDRRAQRLLASLPRQALHAAALSFPHPETGEIVRFEAPLPHDIRELIEALDRGFGGIVNRG